MKPIIGILARPDKSSGGYPSFVTHQSITDAVIHHKGIPRVIIPPQIEHYLDHDITNTEPLTENEWYQLKQEIDACDGILLQGGDDFYDYDIKTVLYCHEHNIPVLGICLGMQTMAMAFQGHMMKLSNHQHKELTKTYVHDVIIDINSKLFSIVKKPKIIVNSRHIWVVDQTQLTVSGTSDNIIEAVEDNNKKFFLGIQWHPEDLKDEESSAIFTTFIKASQSKE